MATGLFVERSLTMFRQEPSWAIRSNDRWTHVAQSASLPKVKGKKQMASVLFMYSIHQ